MLSGNPLKWRGEFPYFNVRKITLSLKVRCFSPSLSGFSLNYNRASTR